ncbi:MAG TPA: 6-pyruvoyl-tetrahydropterin synthase-related protein, partial [Acidimicrobiales bacterium]|nr:6-pyruvoyl-tetrahydropterin synthase-related protein [Acidimicrobiales bacterium]
MRRPSLTTVVSIVVVAGAALFILLQLQPGLLVASTTPAGGDMGAHVWGPAYIRDHLLPHGRISGWTPDWYAGFPAYHFYFPLPFLLIVLLDVVLPYGVAFKLVTVSGLVLLPLAAWTFGRLLRLPFPTPEMLAAATIPFVFDQFHTIWGGNAAATLAGEFSFSIGLAVALVFLGVLNRALETGRGRALAAGLLAVTALCHLLTAAFAAVGALVVLAVRRPDRRRLGIAVVIGVLGAGLVAFWFLPFLARMQYTNDMGWERTNTYLENLVPFLRHDDAAAGYVGHWKVVLPLALVGAIVGLARRRRGAAVITLVAAAMAIG